MVFAYKATPHTTTGFQPYEVMFGCKAPMPCDAWLRLDQYQEGQPVGKAAWLGLQLDTLVSVNKHMIKSIQKTTLRNKLHAGWDELHIPIGNHVLLREHPEGHNQFKDWYKSDVYVIVDSHKEEPNVYYPTFG